MNDQGGTVEPLCRITRNKKTPDITTRGNIAEPAALPVVVCYSKAKQIACPAGELPAIGRLKGCPTRIMPNNSANRIIFEQM
jgi:hypothetical protein